MRKFASGRILTFMNIFLDYDLQFNTLQILMMSFSSLGTTKPLKNSAFETLSDPV